MTRRNLKANYIVDYPCIRVHCTMYRYPSVERSIRACRMRIGLNFYNLCTGFMIKSDSISKPEL